jgi:low affinity Fe/Cu permease
MLRAAQYLLSEVLKDVIMKFQNNPVSLCFERFAQAVSLWSGSTWAFALELATIVIWAGTGFLFHFSDTWQLVINTGTTIVTFLMVFLVQRAQNKDALAIHLKLNEIVAALQGASNRMINVERLSEAEVRLLHSQYETLGELSRQDGNSTRSLSIESSIVDGALAASPSGVRQSASDEREGERATGRQSDPARRPETAPRRYAEKNKETL